MSNGPLQREVEKLFLDLVYRRHPACHFNASPWTPLVDVLLSENGARVVVELAGVPRERVRVVLRGNLLEIRGRREPPREAQPASLHYHRAEIYFGDFRRTIELPWQADEERVEAHYRDGMLEIQLLPASRTTSVTIEHRP